MKKNITRLPQTERATIDVATTDHTRTCNTKGVAGTNDLTALVRGVNNFACVRGVYAYYTPVIISGVFYNSQQRER